MPLTSSDATATTLRSSTNTYSVRLSPSETSLFNSPAYVVVERSADAETVVTAADENSRVIRQTIRAATVTPPGRVVFVFDGSAGLGNHARDIAAGLGNLPPETELAALVAEKEGITVLLPAQKASASAIDELQSRLRRVSFAGGQDNLPALEAGWDLAAANENGLLIWIHAPQPVLLSSGDGLRQRFERSATPPRFLELPVIAGPDRIVEKLDGLPVDHVPRRGALRDDLAELTAQLAGKPARWKFVREQVLAESGTVSGKPASKHVERLWARDEVRRLTKARQREEATKLAAKEQLVTPVTGAVVLETMEQFAQHGLTPVDVGTVPEPETWVLIGVGLAAFGFRRWLKRPRNA